MRKINYVVKKNEIFGRYLVASRYIKQGEIIFSEKPTLIGPPINAFLICFNCCTKITTEFTYCIGCNDAIICKNKCLGTFHTRDECEIFKNKKINFLQNPQIIFPLRCLVLKTTNPDLWNTFMELESHVEVRRNTAIWKRHQIYVADILMNMNLLNEESIREELVQKICGILDVNSFEVRLPQNNLMITNPDIQCLRGLYISAALMAHDCTGNTLLSVDDDFVLTIKASVNIDENSPIFFNYSNVLQGNSERKQHLKEGKYFDCCCKRCSDSSELNSDVSTLKCHKCPKGFVKIIEPNNKKSDWECSFCRKKFKYSLVNIIVEESRNKIQETGQTDINAVEMLHKKLLNTFHPNHFLLLEMQQNMIGIYSCLPPNITNLTKKVEICHKLLEVFDIIEPGISRMRALTLYQMQSAMIDLAHKNYQKKQITLQELFSKLKEAEKVLNECLKHLLHEPIKSPEGRVAHMALNELKMLRTSIGDIHDDILTEDNNENNNFNNTANCTRRKRNKKNKY